MSVTASSSDATDSSHPARPISGSRFTWTWPSPAWPKITTARPRSAAASRTARTYSPMRSTGTQPSSITWSERRVSGSPARIGLAAWRSAQSRSAAAAVKPGVHARGPGRHRRRGALHRLARRRRIVPLDLDQQHRLGPGLADQLEEGAVEQLDGGRLVHEQRCHRIGQGVERAQARPGAPPARRAPDRAATPPP